MGEDAGLSVAGSVERRNKNVQILPGAPKKHLHKL